MDKRVIFLFFLLNVVSVWSSPRMVHLMNKREVYYCGSKLASALALVCNGKYNSPSKKSFDDLLAYDEYNEFFPSETDEDTQFDFPFLQKGAANSLLPMRFRKSKGIVDECCRKPCTLKHLELYCA
ncbi:hypothetical protein Zmor_009468 [Zophobas morio]|uniref:Insulin-like domain-containing protein n=2 Tax=Zophobas TaxID=7073 RepID=A0AA38MID9_9CUCU|nr:hypothetical protein Zmor_009468 [Zophobas morio]UXO98120.1 insulin like peptide 1 [Zophobas atratus]